MSKEKAMTINEKCNAKKEAYKKERLQKEKEIENLLINSFFEKSSCSYILLDFAEELSEKKNVAATEEESESEIEVKSKSGDGKKIKAMNRFTCFSYEYEVISTVNPTLTDNSFEKFEVEDWQELINSFADQGVEIYHLINENRIAGTSIHSLFFVPESVKDNWRINKIYSFEKDENLAEDLATLFGMK